MLRDQATRQKSIHIEKHQHQNNTNLGLEDGRRDLQTSNNTVSKLLGLD